MEAIADIPDVDIGNAALSSRVFDALQGDRFLDRRLVPTSAYEPYDVRQTARRAEIILERAPLVGRFATLTVAQEKWRVIISEEAVEGSVAERFLFAHELGHIFLFECAVGAVRRGLKTESYYRELQYGATHHDKIEHFCDYFAQQAETHWNL